MAEDGFDKGPAFGNWEGNPGHESAARPMEHLKGTDGPDWERPPLESVAEGDSRHIADPGGPAWDAEFRAPMAPPTRGTHIY